MKLQVPGGWLLAHFASNGQILQLSAKHANAFPNPIFYLSNPKNVPYAEHHLELLWKWLEECKYLGKKREILNPVMDGSFRYVSDASTLW